RGQSYLLPTPTLVGQPLDDIAYQALFQGYTRPILDDLRNSLSPPIPLPTQDIVALCFPADGFAPQLAHYSPAGESWTNELPGRAFRYLLPRPGGDGIVLQEDLRGRDASDLRLLLWQPGRETLLFDGLNNQRLARPVAWGSPPANPHLIIQGTTTRAVAQRNWLDLNDCHSDGCRLVPLPAYAIWSNDGQQTILSQDGQMWRGSANGEPLALLGAGFSPFWLDAQTYGYTRYTAPAGVPIAEIVLATAGQDQPHTLLRATDLPDAAGTQFIDYVTANPARPGTLLAAGPILGSSPGRYNIYQITLDENLISSNPAGAVQQVTLAASLPDALRGHPALLTPTGYPPFDISPDGRWLLATMLHNPAGEATAYVATDPAGWTFFLHDLDQGATHQFTAGYPLYPGQYPYYDWSADGRWLLIGDDGYLRLVAPAYDYQRLLPHPYANCLFTAWLNPPAPPR
ncbi:MAG: hypothetical protein KDE29_06765, partial [Anaerolineales bacterium]|nr:hypothetical protein [Anaerolineales bacterium]